MSEFLTKNASTPLTIMHTCGILSLYKEYVWQKIEY